MTPFLPAAGGALCPQDSLSDPSSELTLPTSPETLPGRDGSGVLGGAFTDTAPDRPADPANALSFTVNLSRCLAAHGTSWSPGAELSISIRGIAGNGRDSTEQTISFTRVP